MDAYFEKRLWKKNRWQRFHEIFNVIDINRTPPDYAGSQEEWIQSITTYQQLNPDSWKRLKTEYDRLIEKHFANLNQCRDLMFERTEEGGLRKTDTREHLLRISLQVKSKAEDSLSFARRIQVDSLMDFSMYVAYTKQKRKVKKRIRACLKKELYKRQETRCKTVIPVKLSFEEDVAVSFFQGRDIFVDILNHVYFVL